MKQLQRLLLHQGQRCFFCDQTIPEGEASIEHLAAVSNGGVSADENCVVCCKTLNAAMGNLSVKEKLRMVLAQRSAFFCPRDGTAPVVPTSSQAIVDDRLVSLLPAVVENLRKFGSKRPKKLSTLQNALGVSFPKLDATGIAELLVLLQRKKHVSVQGAKVNYPKLDAGA
jgi:hypothetical protein